MTILTIETSTQVCSAAVCIGGVPVAERISREGGNHASLLPVFVQELLDEVRQRGLRIEAVALSEGPGSYTGLRIGASTAKGLCYGLQVPLIPLSTMQVLAASAAAQHSLKGLLCPMIDARRMEVYTALLHDVGVWDTDQSVRNAGVEARVVEDAGWLLDKGEEVYYFGNGAEKCQQVLAHERLHYLPGIVPEAKYMGVLAEQVVASDYQGADVAYYEPFYLKEFQAAPSHVKGLTNNR